MAERYYMESLKKLEKVTPDVTEITAAGWIRDRMCRDLGEGFTGNLDLLVPDLIVKDDIYGKNRRGEKTWTPKLGILEEESDMQPQHAWWNSETQSNWLDGLLRTSIMVGDDEKVRKAVKFLEERIATQEEDGYIGIYKKEIRYSQGTENGELWAQATLMRALLAYYEYTKDDQILEKIKKALDLTMERYPIGESRPFSTEKENLSTCCGGLSHGLTITDAYLELYRITHEKKYLEYCVFLYEDFSEEKNLESDLSAEDLNAVPVRFKAHGVHTYEHLRALSIYSFVTGRYWFLGQYLKALELYLNPSGAPAGDEWIRPQGADPTVTGYEYCSIHELLHSYCLLLQITGKREWADRTEWLFFNAGLGARHPKESAIAYLKSDNSYSMASAFQVPQPHCNCQQQTRYKYSPVHQDVAVCCVPNAGRIMPYYLQNMWQKRGNIFTKTLYGPSIVRIELEGCYVCIEERSAYPEGAAITILVSVSKKVFFELRFRKPAWWKSVTIEGTAYEEEEDFLIVRREWEGKTELKLRFGQELLLREWKENEWYFSWGAIVLSLPICGSRRIKKVYGLNGMEDSEYRPENQDFLQYELPENMEERLSKEMLTEGIPLWNKKEGREEIHRFVPMGKTILRRVTFPKKDLKREILLS